MNLDNYENVGFDRHIHVQNKSLSALGIIFLIQRKALHSCYGILWGHFNTAVTYISLLVYVNKMFDFHFLLFLIQFHV